MEAKKAFQFAHSLDPKNLQIVIDLADLQVQVRDYAGYRVSKQKMMNERSSENNYWLGFIMGAYLDNKFDLCVDIINTFWDSLEAGPSYCRQELLFIKSDCFAKKKDWAAAIATLEQGMDNVLDKTRAQATLATLYGRAKQLSKSEALWRALLDQNCDCVLFFRGIEWFAPPALLTPSCLLDCFDAFDASDATQLPSDTCSDAQRALLLPQYQALQARHPRSLVIPQVLLRLADGPLFERLLTAQLDAAARKGVPSFFNALRPLCRACPAKFALLKRAVETRLQRLTANPAADNTSDPVSDPVSATASDPADPVAFVWLSLFLAQMEDFEHHTAAALARLDAALAHTPTCYDLYVCKAKVLKHAGAVLHSAEAMRQANELDLADRYMNTARAKSLLRCGAVEEADRVVSYWVRRDVPDRIELNLLQACWFEVPCAEAYWRRGDVPRAYKLFSNVLEHFTTFVQDQFDFHGYVLRKSVLTAYYDFLHAVDAVYRDAYYRRAAVGALRCLMALHEHPLDEAAYKETHTLTPPPVHKKGAEFVDDKDPDGLALCAKRGSLDAGNDVVMELMLYAKDDAEAMRTVFAWAAMKGDTKRCEEAAANLRDVCHLPLDAAYLEGKHIDEQSVDRSSLHNRILLARQALEENAGADVQSVLTAKWEEMERPTIDDCYEAYCVLKEAKGETESFMARVKEHYLGFEEYVKVRCLWCVC